MDLGIKKGETVCLLGPNGCGKTTLLNCIHGDLRLKSGKIKIDGKDVASMNVKDMAHRVGYVFQEHNAPFPYSALEVIRMGRAPHLGFFETPSKNDTGLALDIMATLEISYLADMRYTEISGGERQLVLIARTLCQEPDILLLDEPTSHLDFKNQAMVLKNVKRLSEKGLTILMTTHFPNHAMLFSSTTALLNNEGFLAVGPSAEVMNEDNLSELYGISVRIISTIDKNKEISFCTPVY